MGFNIIFGFRLPVSAANNNNNMADAFSPQALQQSRVVPTNRGFFSNPQNQDSGSGPGKPNDNESGEDNVALPKFPKIQSVEEIQTYPHHIDESIKQLEKITDSESESSESEVKFEEPQCTDKLSGNVKVDSEFDLFHFVPSVTD